jgi:hypothetical protein
MNPLASEVITVFGVSLGQIGAVVAAVFSFLAAILGYFNRKKIADAQEKAIAAKAAAEATSDKISAIDIKVDGNLAQLVEALKNSTPVKIPDNLPITGKEASIDITAP